MEIKCYEEDLQILPTNKPTNIYQYSESILKHMSKDSLKSFKKETLANSKKKLWCPQTKTDVRITTEIQLLQWTKT